MFFISIKGYLFIGPNDLFVHPCLCIPFLAKVLEQLLIGSLFLPDNWCKDAHFSFCFVDDVLYNPVWRLRFDGKSMYWAVCYSNPGI